MRGDLVGGCLEISCSGIEYLKLKSNIASRVGDNFRSTKNSIIIPLNLLHLIEDVVPPEIFSKANVNDEINKYSKHRAARQNVQRILAHGDNAAVPLQWRTILDPAQAVAVAAMTTPNLLGLCLFDEQGSGKTIMTIAAFDVLKSQGIIDAMIVLCPKSMVREWPKDISKMLKEKYSVIVPEGDGWKKYCSTLKRFDILVTNYESIGRFQALLKASAKALAYLLVVDESYYIKNKEAIRSSLSAELRDYCARCFVLCGTPAPNSPYDLVNQFNLADRGYSFGNFSRSNDPYKDSELVSAAIETRGTFIRRLKTDILQTVPEKQFHLIKVVLKGKQLLIYEKARSQLELELRGLDNNTFKKNLATYFQKRSALLQICTCPRAVDPTLNEVPVKYAHIDSLLSELISAGRKVIIWSFYMSSIEDLYERYSRYNPVRIDGTKDANSRERAVQSFQEDPGTMLFIGNPAAAGSGITLHASFDAIYVSYSNQAAHYLQSLDRIHRRGQLSSKVNYYLLMCENTIEETEIVRLRKKELQQHSLLGDHIKWPTSLDDALRELRSDLGSPL
jgi:SNF2 family DNA or RNA helicase